jgi:alpha-L-rhamnosidase
MDIEREETTLGAPLLRTEFRVERPLVAARLFICGLGLYEATVNGRRVSDGVLLQNFTRYDVTVLYKVFDVTPLVAAGTNCLGVELGNGWYNCVTVDPWYTRQASWRDVPKLRCELHLSYADGGHGVVLSKPPWRTAAGPVTFNSIRSGECHDAGREVPGWNLPGFDGEGWQPAIIVRPPGGILRAEEMEPIRSLGEYPAVRKWRAGNGSWVFDCGQNLAGVARITVRGPRGTEIRLYHNECLLPDGSLPREGGFIQGAEFQMARYTKGTDAEETWLPRFVYFGFQYVEVAGLEYEPALGDVTAVFQHTDLARRGRFACSSDTLNGIERIARLSTLSNWHGLPTDCPHREKNGWIGDSAVACEQTIIHHAPMAGYTKWLGDFRDCQKPAGAFPCVVPSTGWGFGRWNGPDYSSAFFTIPWLLYLYGGDRDVLASCYEAMQRQISFIEGMADDLVVGYGGGDWCPPFDGPAHFENMASFKAPKGVTDGAHFHSMTRTLAKVAAVLGRDDDRRRYTELADRIRDSFRRHFFDAATVRVAGDCQTSTGCMLFHGLCLPDEEQPVLDLLVQQVAERDGHLDFGIFGSRAVMNALAEGGRADVARAMADRVTYPGWGWWLARGANTLWECWNGGGSHNHQMFADVAAFLVKHLAGIQPDEREPGFRHVILRPALDCGLAWADGSHESSLGTVRCAWRRHGRGYRVGVTVPVGARASLHLPAEGSERLTEGGRPLAEAGLAAAAGTRGVMVSLASGTYEVGLAGG